MISKKQYFLSNFVLLYTLVYTEAIFAQNQPAAAGFQAISAPLCVIITWFTGTWAALVGIVALIAAAGIYIVSPKNSGLEVFGRIALGVVLMVNAVAIVTNLVPRPNGC